MSQLGYNILDKYRLIGGRLEYSKMRDSIFDFFNDANIYPNDTISFYFSGHGVLGDDGENYLSTSEIDPDMPQRRGISFNEFSSYREPCKSKTIFTILDCCYSGADKLGGKGPEDKAKEAKQVITNKSNILGEGKCILAACKSMQKTYEYKEQGNSLFAFYLAEALNDRECIDEDGDVTPYAINSYINNKINSLPSGKRPKQTPFLNCQTAGKIVLARYPNKKTKLLEDIQRYNYDGLIHLQDEDYNNSIKLFDNVIQLIDNIPAPYRKEYNAYRFKGDTLLNYNDIMKL